jgi:exportin-1
VGKCTCSSSLVHGGSKQSWLCCPFSPIYLLLCYMPACRQCLFLLLVRHQLSIVDTFHKPGFKLQARILHHLFSVAQADVIRAPLWDVAALGPAAYPSNAAFIQAHVTDMLSTSFPNLRPQQVAATVMGMMELREFATFRQHLRDFLVQSNHFADQNNADLYADEVAASRETERERMAKIPGMLHPNELEDSMGGGESD